MKTILAAVDGSPQAKQVLQMAGQLASLFGARLVLFRAANIPVDAEVHRGSLEGERFTQRIRDEELKVLEAQRRSADLVNAELQIGVGPAAVRICEAAQAIEADLIVMGATGLGARRDGIGEVTARVLKDFGSNVLVVRSPPALGAVVLSPVATFAPPTGHHHRTRATCSEASGPCGELA